MQTILLFSNDLTLFTDLEKECRSTSKLSRSNSLENAIGAIEHTNASIIIVDIDSLPPQELDIISYLKQQFPSLSIIIIAEVSSLAEATQALKSGASLYLLKPITAQLLQQTMTQLAETSDLKLQQSISEQKMLKDMMGGSKAMDKVLNLITKVSPTSATILLEGENGTGKEFFAQIIHKLSKVKGSFTPINCGAIPEALFESELFGHKKGAFTGADSDKKGVVEEADNGTLFLDEVGELPLTAQVKLLRFLQERRFRRVGEATERSASTRIIAATNRNLREMVKEGTFREDLFYRLHVFPITLPPLRERKESIPNLITIFLHSMIERYDKHFTGFTKTAEYLLSQHSYPGNIRELENIIEHAAILASPPTINEQDLPEYLYPQHQNLITMEPPSESSQEDSLDDQDLQQPLLIETSGDDKTQSKTGFFAIKDKVSLAELEKKYIKTVLAETGTNHTEAARILGISRSTLWRKLKEE